MDGPLTSDWLDYFSGVLDQKRTFHLDSSEQLPLTSNIRIVFETDELCNSSPSVVARSVRSRSCWF